MLARRSDLPLDRDAHSRLLPWLIAFMVYLATLAMAGALVLAAVAARWDQGVEATLTVQIMPAEPPADDDARLRTVVEALRSMPRVARAEAIPESEMAALLEPWIGSSGVRGDLPLPRLVDVELVPDAEVDAAALQRRLAAVVPGIAVDDHRIWLERFLRLVRAGEALAGAIVLLVGLATVGTVVFTTRTGLAIHQEVIEVLHLIGARDAYVARQFAARALVLGLRGGAIGLLLAVPTLLGIDHLAARMDGGLLPAMTLEPRHWAVLAALPLVVAAIAMLTARLTVSRTLSRMP